jgi:hypothetical protein
MTRAGEMLMGYVPDEHGKEFLSNSSKILGGHQACLQGLGQRAIITTI